MPNRQLTGAGMFSELYKGVTYWLKHVDASRESCQLLCFKDYSGAQPLASVARETVDGDRTYL